MFQNTELVPVAARRQHYHQTRRISRKRRVITHPHRQIPRRTQPQRLVKIRPKLPTVHLAALQIRPRKHPVPVFHKLTHKELAKLRRRVFQLQLPPVKQRAARFFRIVQRHNLPPLPVLTQTTALIETAARPKRIGRMRRARRRRKISNPILLLRRHRLRYPRQLLKILNPKILVHIQIPVIRLRRTRICPQKIQHRPIVQTDTVPLQLYAHHLCQINLILLKLKRLPPRSRQKHLVLPRQKRVNQRLPRKEKRRPDLTAFQQIAETHPLIQPHLLITEQLLAENILRPRHLLRRETVRLRLLRLTHPFARLARRPVDGWHIIKPPPRLFLPLPFGRPFRRPPTREQPRQLFNLFIVRIRLLRLID